MKPGTYRPGQETDELMEWLRDHFIDPADVYQVDVGRRSAIVYRYERIDEKLFTAGGVTTVLPPLRVKL